MTIAEQDSETEETVGGDDTVTLADPDLLESAVDVAVTVADPSPEGEKTPAEVTEPSVADHVTAVL